MDTNTQDTPTAPNEETATTKRRRRHFTTSQKREMVEATLDGRLSVSVVARQYDVNANQLFRWRKQYLDGELLETPSVNLLPVKLAEPGKLTSAELPAGQPATVQTGKLEVVLANQHRLVITGSVCQQSLATVLQVLS